MTRFSLIRPFLHRLDPERAHGVTLWALKNGLGGTNRLANDPRLAISLWGRNFANPVGLAAGFDKDAQVMGPMLALGLGFVEVGSVTPLPQPGNSKPRLFRLLEDDAVINRMGFNSGGLAMARDNMSRWRQGHQGDPQRGGLVGINLGKNRDAADAAADYVKGAAAFAPLADYLVVNVSSPNTPGLRALQDKGELTHLIDRVQAAVGALKLETPPPLLVKVAPDLTDQDKQDIAQVARDTAIDGLIISNTSIARPESLRDAARSEAGGLSGKPLFEPSTGVLRDFYRLTHGRLPLIGVGGIASGADAYAKIRAGASLVQLYSALVFQGPDLIGNIRQDLAKLLEKDGFSSVAEAVGKDA